MRNNIVSYPIEISLRLIGVGPDTPFPIIRQITWTILILIVQSLQYWNLFRHLGTKDMAGWMEGFVLTVTNTVIFNRMLLLWINKRLVNDLFRTMSEDWEESTRTKWKLESMTSKADLAARFAAWIVFFYLFAATFFVSGILCSEYNNQNYSEIGGERLLLKTIFPIDGKYSPLREFLIVEEFFQQVITVAIAGATTAFLISLILHVDGQINIIRQQLSEITLTKDKHLHVRNRLKMVVRRHQRVIDFCDDIEDIFTYMALMVFLVIALLFGCVWFILLVSTDVLMQGIFVVYYMCTLMDVFIYCKMGEYLREKSLSVGQASYETAWYELKPAECQILFLLLLRSQKRLAITAGKFLDLSMEVFASVLKTSLSILSLFYTAC